MKNVFLKIFIGLVCLGCAHNRTTSVSTKTGSVKSKGRRAEVLFLGHTSKHHDSGKYAPWLAIKLFQSGVNMTYTVDTKDLNPENLNKYDGLIIYANHDSLSPSQESAMKAFLKEVKV